MKKNFTEPEMEVVRFDAQEALIATSGCGGDGCNPDGCNPDAD